MIPDFEQKEVWPFEEKKPYRVLSAGVYPSNPNEVKCQFCDDFSGSQTRPVIIAGMFRLFNDAATFGLHITHWLAGSFTTTKYNPEDVDVCSFVHSTAIDQLPHTGYAWVFSCLGGKEASKPLYSTHSFLIVVFPPNDPRHVITERRRAYWRDWFGHTRPMTNPNGTQGHESTKAPRGMVSLVTGDGSNAPVVSTAWISQS